MLDSGCFHGLPKDPNFKDCTLMSGRTGMSSPPQASPPSSIRILPEVIGRNRMEAKALIAGFHGIGATGY